MQSFLGIILIYVTGLLQGLVLIALPAASSVFTDTHAFGFSTSQYGALFVPQVIMSILAALIMPGLCLSWGTKHVYRLGLVFNILAMALLSLSQLLIHSPQTAYLVVMMSASLVGAAFGTTLPVINVYAQGFFPLNPAGALTGLHTLLGTGTAIAPLCVVFLVKTVGWWVMPIASMTILLLILVASFFFSFNAAPAATNTDVQKPRTFWTTELILFLLIVLLYGFCETIFSNWSIIYLNQEKHISMEYASYALSGFWAMVTIGRLIVAVLSKWIKASWFYRILPIMMVLSLWFVTRVHSESMGIISFCTAGLACSAFFPLTFSFGQSRNPLNAGRVAGSLMVLYMIGYGLASYGMGELVHLTGVTLSFIYLISMVIAVIIFGLSLLLTQKND